MTHINKTRTEAVSYSVEFLCFLQDGEPAWCVGHYMGDDKSAAVDECRQRWRAGAAGVRIVERSVRIAEERVRGK